MSWGLDPKGLVCWAHSNAITYLRPSGSSLGTPLRGVFLGLESYCAKTLGAIVRNPSNLFSAALD